MRALKENQTYQIMFYHEWAQLPDLITGKIERFTNRILQVRTKEGTIVRVALKKLSVIVDTNGKVVFEHGEFK